MSVLNVQGLCVSFGERTLFSDVSFEVGANDKIGFIGHNGVGKTTLFKVISGELAPDRGNVFISKNACVGYMEQHACSTKNRTLYTELLSVFSELSRMESELELLNVKLAQNTGDMDSVIAAHAELLERFERNGGLTYKNRSKLSLAKLLLSKADVLLLDEPTNHLDIESVLWLEGFIRSFDGAMIIISHDRYFLDCVTNRTIELENRKIRSYSGGYTEFMRKKKEADKAVENKYKNDLKEIKRIEGIIEQQKRFNQARNYVTAASKQKEIDRIKERLEAPETAEKGLENFRLEPKRESGSDVLMCSELSKSFGGKKLFDNLSMHIKKGERVFILGANGCGKTTLFRLINGETEPDEGEIRFGVNVDVGYFDQMQNNLDFGKTALDWVWDSFPDMTQTRVRTALGRFLFSGDDVQKPISKMSGGERARLALLSLMLRGDNLLLLDEPTNHLDTDSREALEETLLGYEGTMLLVSHDRYFINKLADRILELTPDGFIEYLGNYDYYAEVCASRRSASVQRQEIEQKPRANEYRIRKEQQAQLRKKQTRLKKLEEEIAVAEDEIQTLNMKLQSDEAASDYELLMSLTSKLEARQRELEALYARWEELESELSREQ